MKPERKEAIRHKIQSAISHRLDDWVDLLTRLSTEPGTEQNPKWTEQELRWALNNIDWKVVIVRSSK